MASAETAVLTRRQSLSMHDVSVLCDRLKARSQSAFHRDRLPSHEDIAGARDDMRLAAMALRGMSRSFHVSDLIRIEE
jgi:hypothetical protein